MNQVRHPSENRNYLRETALRADQQLLELKKKKELLKQSLFNQKRLIDDEVDPHDDEV
jgi:hypothetical protein